MPAKPGEKREPLRLSVTFPPVLQDRIEQIKQTLDISTAETIRRALLLYGHAVESDTVTLKKDGKEQLVLLK